MLEPLKRFVFKWFIYAPVTLIRLEPVVFLQSRYQARLTWTNDQIKSWQVKKLRELLSYSMTNSSYYRKTLGDRKILLCDDSEFLKEFSNLPTLTKSDIIKEREQLSTGASLFTTRKTTGGSTGEPVIIVKNSYALACERTATWRSYEWASITIGEKQARFWGVPHSTTGKLISPLIDFVSRRKRFSAFDVSENKLEGIYSSIKKYRPAYIYGYVSAIESLADYIEKHGLTKLAGLKCIITTSEVLTKQSRKKIESNFHVPVFNEYGCGEVGSIAHECSHGSLHVMCDNLYVETEGNELIITDLTNLSMPLIRYKVGDLGRLSNRKCKCGSNFPILEEITGRAYDLIKTPEGKVIHPESVIYVFEDLQKEEKYFQQFQVIQNSYENFTINIIPAKPLTSTDFSRLEEKLKDHISASSRYTINVVEHILRENSGKMRVVKSEIRESMQ